MNVVGDVDIRGWDAFVEQATAEMDTEQEAKFVRAMALTFIGAVIPRTPVDTGRARGGWTAMRGSVTATQGAYGQLGPGAVQGRRESSFTFKSGPRTGTYAEIFNGVPYITYLELGSSQQAPSGFVRLTLRELSGEMAREGERRTEAALRLANIKSRAQIGLRQGLGRAPGSGRANLGRR